MRGLSRAADHGKLWFAAAAALALLGGPSSRLAARRGLVSLGIAPGLATLLARSLRAQPPRVWPPAPPSRGAPGGALRERGPRSSQAATSKCRAQAPSPPA